MLKNIIATSLVAATLILSGCGDAEGESRLAAQNAIDSGDFASAIANLEAKSNRTDSDNLTLASAYMGEAGFSFTDVITLMGTDDASTGSAGGFETFAKQVDTAKTSETLALIDKAIAAYSAISTVTQAPSRAPSVAGDADLFLGIAYMTKATVVMSYLGDISNLGSADSDLRDTSDAILCVYASDCSNASVTATALHGGVVVTTRGNDRLATADGTKLILTNYADNTLARDADYTIKEALIETINGGFTSILNFAPEEVQGDIVEYRNEIIYSDLIVGNDNIDNHNVVDYNSTHLSFDGGNIRSNDIDEEQIASFLEK